ncbi:MAG: PTS sugar transporter subunit IIA [Pseudomonadota bacterium]
MTIEIADLLHVDRVACHRSLGSKKIVLETASKLLESSTDDFDDQQIIFEALIKRERLGSTGMGDGIALPHGRIDGLTEARGALITLESPIEFDSLDEQPVDLIFALVVPQNCSNDHLQILASLAQLFSDKSTCSAMRDATNEQDLLALVKSAPSLAQSA